MVCAEDVDGSGGVIRERQGAGAPDEHVQVLPLGRRLCVRLRRVPAGGALLLDPGEVGTASKRRVRAAASARERRRAGPGGSKRHRGEAQVRPRAWASDGGGEILLARLERGVKFGPLKFAGRPRNEV